MKSMKTREDHIAFDPMNACQLSRAIIGFPAALAEVEAERPTTLEPCPHRPPCEERPTIRQVVEFLRSHPHFAEVVDEAFPEL